MIIVTRIVSVCVSGNEDMKVRSDKRRRGGGWDGRCLLYSEGLMA